MVAVGCFNASPAAAAPCPDVGATAAQVSSRQIQESFLCLVNRARKRERADGVLMSGSLETAAAGHSQDMRDNLYFAHDSLDGRTFVDRIRATGYLEGRETEKWLLGETLAWSVEASSQPATIFKALMESPAHHRVIVDARYREIGIGLTRGTPEGATDGVVVTFDFGTLSAAPAEGVTVAGETATPQKRPRKRGKPKPKANASSTGTVFTSSTEAFAPLPDAVTPLPAGGDPSPPPADADKHDKKDKDKGRD
jgi:uncharacterized protein YkwD